MPVFVWLLAAVPVAWLPANHYWPWLSAIQDGLALALTAAAALLMSVQARVPRPWALAIALAAATVITQWAAGVILFGGDALMVLIYLGAFALALALGSGLPQIAGGIDALAGGLLFAALVSVAIALVQWTGALSLGIYAADLPPGARPFGNVAQPNHLCTLIFLGLCGALIWRETGRLGGAVFWLTASFLLFGMAMTVSRTGWLQMAALLALVATRGRRLSLRTRWPQALGLAAILTIATVLWPLLNHALLLAGGRGATEQIEGGVRFALWRALADAVGRHPLAGWGWQQVTLAQQAVALDHPPIQRQFEHSHNIVLDLLIWAGIPVGAAIAALAALALYGLVRGLRDGRALWLVVAVAGVLMHAMVELPLEYAYFLVPTGAALGAAQALGAPRPGLHVPAWLLRGAGALFLAAVVAIGVEYFRAEQTFRIVRLESAHIGTTRVGSDAVELHLLTQLGAYLEFMRTEAHPGMSAGELERMRRVAARFDFPPAMLRYALAAGLNGDPVGARQTLARLCSIHLPARCNEARASWRAAQERYPVLAGIHVPATPRLAASP